jgi:glycosyltransferase involved in cell wall biosynthesis
MVFHVVALPHTEVRKEFVNCAYTMKVLNFCRMMHERGHSVLLYGAGDTTDAPCSEYIPVITTAERLAFFPTKDQPADQIKYDRELPYWKQLNEGAAREIKKRIRDERDFLCIIFGTCQEPVGQLTGMKPVEFGIGYTGICPDSHRVFESQAWRNHVYGLYKTQSGSNLDTVVHNYYDPAEFGLGAPSGYFFFMGRLIENKGHGIALAACEQAGQSLVLAGMGSYKPESPAAMYVGHQNIAQRKQWMAEAEATFVMTKYIGPFEGVHAEAMLSGCPVITSDFGVFPETVKSGFNGFRCNSMSDIQAAMKAVGKLDRTAIRQWAIETFSLSVIGEQYERYFQRLLDGGYGRKG